MLFNSFAFLIFFPVVCVIYFALPNLKLRNMFLLVASYYFYMNWEPVYALLLFASTGITYFAAMAIGGGQISETQEVVIMDRHYTEPANLVLLQIFQLRCRKFGGYDGLVGHSNACPRI